MNARLFLASALLTASLPAAAFALKTKPGPADAAPTSGELLAQADTSLIAQASPAQADDVATIVERVQQAYDQVRDLTADFTQEYTSATLGDTRSSSGRVYFKKPGMMRWDYSSPSQRFLISDGSNLWVYEPEFAQYFSEALSDSQLPSALRFLMGQGRLADEFTITIPRRSASSITLELVPKTPNSQFTRLHYVVDASTWQVRETTVFDALGNTNRLIFSNLRENGDLPDSGFTFTPPRGATRVEAP